MSPRREKRVLEHLKAGVHLFDLLRIEGLDPGDRKSIKNLAQKNGLKIIDGPRSIDNTPFVYGANNTHIVRIGNMLVKMKEKHDSETISSMIGLTAREQRRAVAGKHDWTLSQLYRICTLFNTTPDQVLSMVGETNGRKFVEYYNLVGAYRGAI